MEKLTLTSCPESSLAPKKIIVTNNVGDVVAHIYVDGEISMNASLFSPDMLKQLIMIAENFWLFYGNVKNVNQKE